MQQIIVNYTEKRGELRVVQIFTVSMLVHAIIQMHTKLMSIKLLKERKK
jgi:hypothetical protein